MDTALLIFPHFPSLSSFNTLPHTSYPLVSNPSLHRPSRATIQPSTPNSTPSKQTPIWAWQVKKTMTPLPVSDSVRPKLVRPRYTLIEPENVRFSFSSLYPSPPLSTTVLSGLINVKSLSIHVPERRIQSLYPRPPPQPRTVNPILT